jgi:methylated-DNA-[protein]-cysteine S-methyltransferase
MIKGKATSRNDGTTRDGSRLELTVERLASPFGDLAIVCDRDCVLRALEFEGYDARLARLLAKHYGKSGYQLRPGRVDGAVKDRLVAYLDGDIGAIDTIEVRTGGTEFQREVWAQLRKIPAGATASYGDIARNVGRPAASRAVGLANGANPVVIVVPCHRVIGSNGRLTGYGGGLDRKRALLAHEAASMATTRAPTFAFA